ncbi:MAG: hypothetical protein J6I49_05500 [Bacteroidales bacterium]|nr:hypothetical protein [Bacteroidales bacterium]
MKSIFFPRWVCVLVMFLPLAVAAQQADEVYLDDRESHAWSYYSDPRNPVRSLNPADVKITYFGYGAKTLYSSNAAAPAGSPDVDVASGQVGLGIDAPGKNKYVYWKTLERRGGTTATSVASSTGPCKYRVIPNPFSLRPTYGSGDTRWRGFYRWRVKRLTGGAIYTDMACTQSVTQGQMVDPEQLLWLRPAAEYGMEIDFEAIWARAFVFGPTMAAGGINATDLAATDYASAPNAQERNFVVLTSSNIASVTLGSGETDLAYNMLPATVMGLYPDGTNGSSSTRLTVQPGVALNQHFFCMADTKFEYIYINGPTKMFACNDYNMTIGRGCGNSAGGQSLRRIGGMSNVMPRRTSTTDTVTGVTTYTIVLGDAYDEYDYESSFFLRIESGQYKDVIPHWCGSSTGTINSDWTWVPGVVGQTNQPSIYNGSWNAPDTKISHITFGSDYDRSIGDNSRLMVTNYIFGSYAHWNNMNPDTRYVDQYNWYVKSGDFLPGRYDYGQGGATAFYLGGVGYNTGYMGHRCIDVEGGLVQGIAGGMDESLDENGVQYVWTYVDLTDTNIWIRVRGGQVRGHIYGGGEYVEAGGSKRIVVTGGTVNGWIAGGANGTDASAGELNGDTYIYIGGRARVEHTAADHQIGASKGGYVYGAGCGNPDASSSTATTGKVQNSTVVIADSCYISRNVYGGGHFGGVVGGGSRVYLLGGTVAGKVFGGAHQQIGKQVDILMLGGQVKGGIYGGSNLRGEVSGPVDVRIEGGTVGYEGCPDTLGSVFGSGYGENTFVLGDVEVTIGNEASRHPHRTTPVVHGNIYGGGFSAPYVSAGKTFRVTSWNGEVKGNIFGGGLGGTAVITGDTRVNLYGTSHVRGNVYGGGNMGKVTGSTSVIVGEDDNMYTITVLSSNSTMGSATGGGIFQANHSITLQAFANDGYRFLQWSDGRRDNPRTVIVSRDASYTAEFEVRRPYTITATSSDPSRGTVTGGGTYLADEVISLRATPIPGYRFAQWTDGNTQNPRSVTVEGNATYTAEFDELDIWVDMGLPSGVLWASVNVGANEPEGYGGYYSWGEVETKSIYDWANYRHCAGAQNQLTKYCTNSSNGYEGATDGLTTLQAVDDIATQTFGPGARIPTMAEWQELFDNTTQTNDVVNGVAGRRFTSTINGNSIFCPFTGYKSSSSTYGPGSCTYFWSSTLSSTTNANAVDVYITNSSGSFYSGSGGEGRFYGFPIRAVYSR